MEGDLFRMLILHEKKIPILELHVYLMGKSSANHWEIRFACA